MDRNGTLLGSAFMIFPQTFFRYNPTFAPVQMQRRLFIHGPFQFHKTLQTFFISYYFIVSLTA